MISVKVVLVGVEGTPIRTSGGRVDPSQEMHFIKADIIRELGGDGSLGDPKDWKIAVSPASDQTPLDQYHPAQGDTIYLLKSDVGRRSSFEPD